jgi:bifunctional enzyme CysN/CysC
VDDGKSTLIGRLLHDAQAIPEDTLAHLARDSARHGTTGEATDLALLTDGLEAEREQGITIDVAWRYFATPRRAFMVADTPGHEQFTRNMATGASQCDLAVLLVDARKGLLTQTRRHATICARLGVRQLVLAVNKMDLVGFDAARFAEIAGAFRDFAARLHPGLAPLAAIPLAARFGDNVAARSARMSWYDGPTLLAQLERAETGEAAAAPFRLPVQWVNRPHDGFRGFAGSIAGGRIARGEALAVAGSGERARVARILGPDGEQDAAGAGEAVTLRLDSEIDIARGDLLCDPAARPAVADQFAAELVWLDAGRLVPGRAWAIRCGTAWSTASVTSIRHRLEVDTQERLAARELAMNEIGLVHLATATPLAFDAYAGNRATGGFILVDRASARTVAAGMISHPLRRARNLTAARFAVDREARAGLAGQRPLVVWLTGLPGSGKSTIADLVERALHARGRHTYTLDGDNLRFGLNRDLGFSEADRVENIRRAGEVARLLADAGLVVLCSFISPYRAERDALRERLGAGEFFEVFVDTPLDACIARDPKGLYARALAGEIPNFTGVNAPYETPEAPELVLRTADRAPEESAGELLAALVATGRV